jgi:multidrug transporter EmrE-like cation transporter
MNTYAAILVLSGVILNALAQLFLKMATNKVGVIELSSLFSLGAMSVLFLQWPMLLGLFCYGFSLFIWLVALSRVDVTLAYPMLAIGYIINAFGAQYLLNEPVSIQRWLAIGVIILGVVLLARS